MAKNENSISKWWHAFKVEFSDRIWSSKKRLIKTVAICFIPFLYGFICIWAFWNPIPQIGAAPMALVNQDKSQVMVTFNHEDKTTKKDQIGFAGVDYYTTVGSTASTDKHLHNTFDAESLNEALQIKSGDKGSVIELVTFDGNILKTTDLGATKSGDYHDAIDISVISDLMKTWETGNVDGVEYNKSTKNLSMKVNDEITLSNIKYIDGQEANDMATLETDSDGNPNGEWKTNDDSNWLQIQIPYSFTQNILGTLESTVFNYDMSSGSTLKPTKYFMDQMTKAPINMWSTYKKNFLYGQFMYIFNEFKSSMLVDLAPQMLLQTVVSIADEQINQSLSGEVYKPDTTWTANGIKTTASDPNSSMTFSAGTDKYYAIKNDAIKTQLIASANKQGLKAEAKLIDASTSFEGNEKAIADSNSKSIVKNLAAFFESLLNNSLVNKGVTIGINKIIGSTSLESWLINPADYAKDGSVNQVSYKLPFSGDTTIALMTRPSVLASILEQDSSLIDTTTQTSGKTDNADIKLSYGIKPITTTPSDLVSTWLGYKTDGGIKDATPVSFFQKQGVVSALGYTTKDNKQIYNKDNNAKNYIAIRTTDPTKNNPSLLHNMNTNLTGIANILGHSGSSYDGFINKDIFTTNIEGAHITDEGNPYGIGLGEFFLCIGLWVGVLMQSFVYDREKRDKAASAIQWYLSKTGMMLLTGTVQCTILMVTVGMLGWFAIGPVFGLQFLWMLVTTWTFVIIEQALWFSFSDETIGKFFCVLYLIVNLSSGWGTFPPSMQDPFFGVIGHIAPYTYSIQGQGAIIYGIGTNGSNWMDNQFILERFGILILMSAIFFALGLYVSGRRNAEVNYGTAHKTKLLKAFRALGYEELITKQGWIICHKLPNVVHQDVIDYINENFDFDPKFKSYLMYKNNNHHKISKRNIPVTFIPNDTTQRIDIDKVIEK